MTHGRSRFRIVLMAYSIMNNAHIFIDEPGCVCLFYRAWVRLFILPSLDVFVYFTEPGCVCLFYRAWMCLFILPSLGVFVHFTEPGCVCSFYEPGCVCLYILII